MNDDDDDDDDADAKWPIIRLTGHIIHHITCTRIWLYSSVHLSVESNVSYSDECRMKKALH